MPYRTVLLDLDHTLFDSDESARRAFVAAMGHVGVPATDHIVSRFFTINLAMWERVEAGDLSPNDIRFARFEELFAGERIDADARDVGDRYVSELGDNGDLFDGAERLLDQIASVATLCLVTNGIGEVQRTRIDRLGLDRWFRAFIISGEVGVSKPDPAIFDLAFAALGEPDRASAVMVGDSLTSDMAGGIAAGIDTAWYNPGGRSSNGTAVTHEFRRLDELVPIIDPG